MDGFSPTSRPSPAASILDLELPILDSKAAARVASIVVDEMLACRHPTITPPQGTTLLLLDDDTVEALNHTITNLLTHTKQAAEIYRAAQEGAA